MNGEIWKAERLTRMDDPPSDDEEVEIVDVDASGLTVLVR